MGFKEIYLCWIYFKIIYLNNIKSMNKVTRKKNWFWRRKRRREVLVAKADLQWKLVSGIQRGNVFTNILDVQWIQTRSTAHPILATWKLNIQSYMKPHEIWIYIWKRDKNYMQINLLNMYNIDLQIHMLWDTEKISNLTFPNTLLLIQLNHSSQTRFRCRNWEENRQHQ